MGEVANYAPPDKVHEWQKEIADLMEQQHRQSVQGVYDYLASFGAWVQPH